MNEFVARYGIISKGNIIVTGSVTASAGFFGTASNALSASWAPVGSSPFANSASWASSSYFANSASYASASLFASFATSASWASGSYFANSASFASASLSSSFSSYTLSSSYAVSASVLAGFAFFNSGTFTASVGVSQSVVSQYPTGSYVAAWFDYVAYSGSNQRAGTCFGDWSGLSIQYDDFSVPDIGLTDQLTMSISMSSGFVQLVASTPPSGSWTFRAMGRFL